MKYTIIMMSGTKVNITEEDYKSLANKEGKVYIPSANTTINTASIETIMPEQDNTLQERKNNKIGILHDGTRVIRHFGVWYLDGEFHEEGGRIIPSKRIDPVYYPEVGIDCVPNEKEYKKFALIENKEERLKAILGGKDIKRISSEGFKKLGEL